MSRDKEFRARDKKTHKMTRDGLVEQNQTAGTEERISQRLADVSFDKARPAPEVLGKNAGQKQPPPRSKQGAKPTDFVEHPPDVPPSQERFADSVLAPDWEPGEPTSTMRGASDTPLLTPTPTQPEIRSTPRRGKHKGKGKTQRGTPYQAKFTESSESESPESGDAEQGVETPPTPHPSAPERGRLQFDQSPRSEKSDTHKAAQKKQAAARFAESDTLPADATDTPPPAHPLTAERGRLQFDKPGAEKTAAKANRQRQTAKFSADAARPEGAPRLRYDKSELPPEEQPTASAPDKEAGAETGDSGTSRQQKKYNKAERKVRDTDEKLEKAKEKLPQKRRVKLEKQYDSDSGKVKRRLQFEKEVIPQGSKGNILKRAGKGIVKKTTGAAVMGAHLKLREVERENVALEAAHKGEFAAERYVSHKVKLLYRHHKNAPYERVAKLQRRQTKANVNMAYQQAIRDNPALEKRALAKWMQKQKIKRKYAQAARETKKGVQHTQQVLNATGQIVRAIAQFVAAHKAVIGAVAAGVLIIILLGAGLSSCGAMISGMGASIFSTCYVADDKEINDSELLYTELEADLQKDIDDTERNHPGFDEYRYNIGEISHNPYELMGYLSAAYDDFTFAQVQAEINRLFGEQYQLSREEIVEVRTYTDEDGDEHEYNWYVLQTTLTVKPMGDIIQNSLPPGEQSDRYDLYMQTYGNRQNYGNPFSFPWLAYVTSPYGYRVHPISGEKDLHRGMDIGVASGTPIQSIQDGRVISAGDAGDYGLCVVIEDDKGYQSRYAHCSSLSVSAGQEVKRGDVIAAVGNTGNSTGAHLHLEVKHNGEYLNPYYFVDTGSDGPGAAPGTSGGVEIPDDSGSPMGDGSWEAMLAEAEKHLGRPYVWGGSSPSTSFDCSGYVSWVINQSGVGSVGRQTAQGLFNITTPTSRVNAQPGDLIFFTGTYSSSNPVTHVGIYVGGGRMIHCGDPISYANIDSNYWTQHFYAFGRL